MGCKVNSSPKNDYGFMNLFGVDSGVETLKMAPFHMLVLRMVEVVAKVEVDFVAVSKLVLESHDYGLFGSLFGGDY